MSKTTTYEVLIRQADGAEVPTPAKVYDALLAVRADVEHVQVVKHESEHDEPDEGPLLDGVFGTSLRGDDDFESERHLEHGQDGREDAQHDAAQVAAEQESAC